MKEIFLLILLAALTICFIGGLVVGHNTGYLDGRHDGWWARDRGGCMYESREYEAATEALRVQKDI